MGRQHSGDLKRILGSEPEEGAGLQEIWDMMEGTTKAVEEFPQAGRVSDVWQALEAHAAPRSAAARSPMRWRGPRRVLIGAGLGLSLAATLAFLFMPVTATAPVGQMRTVALKGGTTVVLNSGARLSYGRFSDRRVRLEGEAFFDVVPGEGRFSVETADAVIEVLGTRFSVRAWNQGLDEGTRVYLEEGSVNLRATSDALSVTMTPGDVRHVRGSAIELLTPTDPSELAAWREGAFIYRDVRVGTILDDFSRRYGSRVVASESVRERRMTLVLRAPQDETAVLDDLAGALGVRYQPAAGGYRVVE
jgi:transmembrane sensor